MYCWLCLVLLQLHGFANGTFKFSIEQEPKRGSWCGKELEKILQCPVHNNRKIRVTRPVSCTCGYHVSLTINVLLYIWYLNTVYVHVEFPSATPAGSSLYLGRQSDTRYLPSVSQLITRRLLCHNSKWLQILSSFCKWFVPQPSIPQGSGWEMSSSTWKEITLPSEPEPPSANSSPGFIHGASSQKVLYVWWTKYYLIIIIQSSSHPCTLSCTNILPQLTVQHHRYMPPSHTNITSSVPHTGVTRIGTMPISTTGMHSHTTTYTTNEVIDYNGIIFFSACFIAAASLFPFDYICGIYIWPFSTKCFHPYYHR